MISLPQICEFSPPQAGSIVDLSVARDAGYEVVLAAQMREVELWIDTLTGEALLIIAHPSALQGLSWAESLLKGHPDFPIILAANGIQPSHIRQALELGLYDVLELPSDPNAILFSLKRCFSRLQSRRARDWPARILSEIKEGFILADFDGRLLIVNPSAKSLFPSEGEQLEGKLVREVFQHPDLQDIFSLQKTYPHRSEIALEDGRVFSAQASLINDIGIAVVLQEITHLKEIDRIKTDFVNTVSHDLRSPLTAIYGFAGLIDRVGPINEQQVQFIRHIQSSVQNITALINDLLELGRLEAGHDIQLEDVDLKEITTQCVNNLDYQVSGKMHELVLSFPDEMPKVLGNPLQLQRMITNLVDNAIKFTPALGKICVRGRVEANQLFIEVADSGPGIPLDDQPHVFDKFFRSNQVASNIPGTGLGLSIVKSIVDKHHGRIWLESSPQGTTFTVILPVK